MNKRGPVERTGLKKGEVIVKSVIPTSNKFLKDLADVLTEQPYLTVSELSRMFCCKEQKIKDGIRYITSTKCSDVHDKMDFLSRQLIGDICELLAINSTLTNKELSFRLGIDESIISRSRKFVTDEDMLHAQQALIKNYGTGMLQCIGDFKPTITKYTDKTGKTWDCLNEFVGIVENGGKCYEGKHFTIPGPDKMTFAVDALEH